MDQHPETQLHDLRAMAGLRGFQIAAEYTDRISGTKAHRLEIDRGDSLTDIAKAHRVSRATVSRLLKQAKDAEPVSI